MTLAYHGRTGLSTWPLHCAQSLSRCRSAVGGSARIEWGLEWTATETEICVVPAKPQHQSHSTVRGTEDHLLCSGMKSRGGWSGMECRGGWSGMECRGGWSGMEHRLDSMAWRLFWNRW